MAFLHGIHDLGITFVYYEETVCTAFDKIDTPIRTLLSGQIHAGEGVFMKYRRICEMRWYNNSYNVRRTIISRVPTAREKKKKNEEKEEKEKPFRTFVYTVI